MHCTRFWYVKIYLDIFKAFLSDAAVHLKWPTSPIFLASGACFWGCTPEWTGPCGRWSQAQNMHSEYQLPHLLSSFTGPPVSMVVYFPFSEIDKSLGIIKDLLGYETFCRKILCGCHDQQSAFSALDRVIMNWTELYQGLASPRPTDWWRTTTYFDKFPIVLSHLSLHTDGCWGRAKPRFLACNANSRQIRIMEYFGLILKSF